MVLHLVYALHTQKFQELAFVTTPCIRPLDKHRHTCGSAGASQLVSGKRLYRLPFRVNRYNLPV